MIAKSTRRPILACLILVQLSMAETFPYIALFANSSNSSLAANTSNKAKNSTNTTSTAAAARSLARARKDHQDHENWRLARALIYFWLVLLGIFALSLFALIFRRYIRTVSSLSPGNTQVYFRGVNRHWGLMKKHFIFAPLIHKRHHRPFMLSRKRGIDNGCLPSRVQMSILVTYFGMLVIATFTGIDYSMKKHDMLLALTRRMGTITLVNMIPLFVLSMRNNPLINLTGLSFDTYNLFHRWLGRFVVVEIIAHAITYLVRKVEQTGWESYRKLLTKGNYQKASMVRYGTIAGCMALLILFQTPAPLRHKFYEIFLHLHQALVIVMLFGVWKHMEGYRRQRPIVAALIAIWSIERFLRLVRIFYRNIGKPITKAEIQIMSPIAMRVKVRLARPWTFTPGQHAYIYMPSVGLWTAHPFSVAWTDEDTEEVPTNSPSLIGEKDTLPVTTDDYTVRKRNIYFLIRRMKGFTNSLYVKTEKAGGKLTTTALVEGPYNQQTLHSYGTVVLVAAGIGITHLVPHVYDLVKGYGLGTVAAKRVVLIWSVRTLEELDLIRDWMTIILALPRRAEVLRVMLYVFALDESKISFPSTTIQVFPGIAKFEPIMDEEVKNSIGSIGVSCCGIGVVADEVRFACRKWMDKVNIEFMEESFSW